MTALPGVAEGGPVATTGAVLAAGGPALPELLEALEHRLAVLATGHGPLLATHAGATIAAGGKRLRPLLVLLAADAGHAGDHAADPGVASAVAGALRAAAAVELVHSATLVHDDVLDAAPLRRGRPTVAATAGRGIATATGDLLFSRAFAELVGNRDADQLRVLSTAASGLAEGELLQRADAWNPEVTVERYLRRCELKTARLFEAACRLGAAEAIHGAVPGDELGRFGLRIGLAFQLLDDVLDVSGPTSRTGKPRGADLLDGTVTLPLILARQRDPTLAELDLRSLVSPEQVEPVCERIEATGALDSARERALSVVAEAKVGLPPDLPDRQRRTLELVADATVARYT